MALDDRDVTYGDVTFRISKMLPMEAKEVFMRHVRPLLSGASAVQGDGGGLAMIVGIIAKAPQEHYDAVMKALYRLITFTSPATQQPLVLVGNEELAFKDLDMAHVLLLDTRAFTVNFRGSWDVLQSEFPQLGQGIASLSQEIPTPSSGIP